MPHSPARFRQADISRALRAVKECSVDMRVKLHPDGCIVIEKTSATGGDVGEIVKEAEFCL